MSATVETPLVKITKAMWNALPENEKRIHKDKRKFVFIKTPSRDGVKGEWQEVYWQG